MTTPLCVYNPVGVVTRCQVREERYDNLTREVDREFGLAGLRSYMNGRISGSRTRCQV